MRAAAQLSEVVTGLHERQRVGDHVALPRADDGFQARGHMGGDLVRERAEAPLAAGVVDAHEAPGWAHTDLGLLA
jgi:hypothetical protein